MDWLSFISSVVASLAWPLVVVAFLILMRNRLGALIERLEELTLPTGARAKFVKQFDRLRNSSELVVIEETRRLEERKQVEEEKEKNTERSVSFKGPEAVFAPILNQDPFFELANNSPEAAVIHSFTEIERILLLNRERVSAPGIEHGLSFIMRALYENGLLDQNSLRLFESLQNLRNAAVHFQSKNRVTPGEAIEFRVHCRVLEKTLSEVLLCARRLRNILPEGAVMDSRFDEMIVGGLTSNSRRLKPHDLFVAVPGTKVDGLSFVPQALANGAAAIMAERAADVPAGVAMIVVPNVRRALALAASAFFPRQPGTIAAVTGTSGKTSVAAFARQIWASLGLSAASMGTVGVVSDKTNVYGSLTTPDPIELHKMLDRLAGEGVTHLALEASSHGLDQHRLDGVRIAAGGFTNLSRDHLDYHPTIEAYLAAKLRLFTDLIVADGTAVIDVDDCYAPQVVAAAKTRGLAIMTVGEQGDGIRLVDGAIDGFAQRVTLSHAGRGYKVRLPLVGGFQVHNAALAAGLCIATGAEPARVFAALDRLEGAKGRLELAGTRNGAPIFIDYAHKPDALQKALEALRPYTTGKLVLVFGAGGDRDSGKRPIMGRIAAESADRVIVTDDNPRSEQPATIRAAILAEAKGATEIGDRAEAIRAAIAGLAKGDVLLIAGKGHETGQIVGDRVLPFSDHEAVAAALKELGA